MSKFGYLGDPLGDSSGLKESARAITGKVQGIIFYFDDPRCILSYEGKDLQSLCPECADIWD